MRYCPTYYGYDASIDTVDDYNFLEMLGAAFRILHTAEAKSSHPTEDGAANAQPFTFIQEINDQCDAECRTAQDKRCHAIVEKFGGKLQVKFEWEVHECQAAEIALANERVAHANTMAAIKASKRRGQEWKRKYRRNGPT